MQKTPEFLQKHRSDILSIAHKHSIGRISVFGSFACWEAAPESDVDFLIEAIGATPPGFRVVWRLIWRNYWGTLTSRRDGLSS